MAKYPNYILDDIKNRLSVSQVVGKYVKLTKKGREYIGLSPFNKEKTPSFTVNDQKQFYHCFSSGKHGNIFNFLMEVKGFHFSEVVEILAKEAGVNLPKPDPINIALENEREKTYKALKCACDFFIENLHKPIGRNALDYLKNKRGFSDNIINRFQIGFSLHSRTNLKEYLISQGFDIEIIKKTGLLIFGEDIAIPYDRFRSRIMFPIKDIRGNIIAFGGRIIEDGDIAKYINSSETELFKKRNILYNMDIARNEVYENGYLLVVEGYLDVISLNQFGINSVVAPLGTALTEEQLKYLWSIQKEPILCFDGDKSGINAALRVMDLALEHVSSERNLKFIILPDNNDPDTIVREKGELYFKNLVDNATPLSQFMLLQALNKNIYNTAEKRSQLEKSLFDKIQRIKDNNLRFHYNKFIRSKLNDNWKKQDSYNTSYSKNDKNVIPFVKSSSSLNANNFNNIVISSNSNSLNHEDMLIALLVYYPYLAEKYTEEVGLLEVESVANKKRLNLIIDYVTSNNAHNFESFKDFVELKGVSDSFKNIFDNKTIKKYLGYDKVEDDPMRIENIWQDLNYCLKANSLQKKIKEVKNEFAQDLNENNFEYLKSLQDQLSVIDEKRQQLLENESDYLSSQNKVF